MVAGLLPDRSSNFSIQSFYFNLIYASQGAAEGQIAAYNCTIEMSQVETGVACDQKACRVNRMRRSLIDTRSPGSHRSTKATISTSQAS
jgi:hypothetical protein